MKAISQNTANGTPCKAKERYLAEQQRRRREAKAEERKRVKAALMLAARVSAPTAPNQREKLALVVGEEQLAQAEHSVYLGHPHLDPARDGALVTSLCFLNIVLAAAWRFFSSGRARIAHATRSGRVTWNAGLKMLLMIEETRRRISAELAVTPTGKRAVGININLQGDGDTVVIAGDTREYIAALRALRGPPPELPALPPATFTGKGEGRA